MSPADWAAGDPVGGPYNGQAARVAIGAKYGITYTDTWTARSGEKMAVESFAANSGMWETEADWVNRQAILSGPETLLNLPDPAAIQKQFEDKMPKTADIMNNVRDQLQAKLVGKLGDWSFKIPVINRTIGLNGWRDYVIAGIMIAALTVVIITQPITGGLILVLVLFIVTYVNAVAKLQNELQKKLTAAQSQINSALKNFSSEASAAVAGFADQMSSATLGALNTVSSAMTTQMENAVNSIPDVIHAGSDLPKMKLPIVAVRNVTTKDCEILIPAGATCHLWIIGKVGNPLNGFFPRAMSQMNMPPDLRNQLEQFLHSKLP